MRALFLGIDPGLSGAIALVNVDGQLVAVEDMPIAARGSGRVKHEVDAGGIAHPVRPRVRDMAHGIVAVVGAMPSRVLPACSPSAISAASPPRSSASVKIGLELLPRWSGAHGRTPTDGIFAGGSAPPVARCPAHLRQAPRVR